MEEWPTIRPEHRLSVPLSLRLDSTKETRGPDLNWRGCLQLTPLTLDGVKWPVKTTGQAVPRPRALLVGSRQGPKECRE